MSVTKLQAECHTAVCTGNPAVPAVQEESGSLLCCPCMICISLVVQKYTMSDAPPLVVCRECEAEDIQQQQLTFQQNKQQSRKASSGQGRHAYFRARKLQRVTEVF